ncbi:pilus assembly protein PilP [Herbaspirillum rhizosphaerae]|uniref:pilus assembly protein PilP n=1 Tax=Herbaspirillum rhizosphaerae TaxID=346179 RepID=UPI001F0AEFAF|nr:pilus assembly protein PilP [Herbaspirillum rhizosphaerae]
MAAMALAGCAERETPEQLQAWFHMAHNNAITTPPRSAAAPAFLPLPYEATTGRTPFEPIDAAESYLLHARPAQRGDAQPLEEFPLESIRMVGTISQENRRYVLLQADRIVYLAKSGDYLGKNFGVIRRIADDEIELEELLPAAEGRWTTRQALLSLQGGRK